MLPALVEEHRIRRDEWTRETEMLALGIDYLAAIHRILHCAYMKNPHPEPTRVPRPWDIEPAAAAPLRPSEFFKTLGR